MLRKFSCRNLTLVQSRASAALWTSARFTSTESKTEEAKETKSKPEEKEKAKMIDDNHPLMKELAEAKAEAAELKKNLLYAVAETDTARRIGRDDAEKAKNYAITSFAKDMVEVADVLDRAVESFATMTPGEIEANKLLHSIFTGIKMSGNMLSKNLGKHGVEKMTTAPGEVFDVSKHEAIYKGAVTDAIKSDHVINVLKPGYTIKGRCLRPAQVGVAE